jgi:hydroxypyruvate isomerase
MLKFASNITMMFNDRPLLDRITASAEAGFGAVECSNPYDVTSADFAQRVKACGVEVALINLPPGNWAAGDRGMACDPNRTAEFRQAIDIGIEFAQRCGAKKMNCLAGIIPSGVSVPLAHATLVENLKVAAARLGDAGIALMLEPINTYDLPGFAVSTSSAAMSIIDAVDSKNLFLQYDVYHMQRMEGELVRTMERLAARIGHVQIADNPGRHEPGTGEINYDAMLDTLERIGFTSWIGCEYAPMADTAEGLVWIERYQARTPAATS